MNKERLNSALIQKNILSKLPNTNQNIVKFHGSQIIKSSDKTTIVTVIQLCSGGSLFDLLQKRQSIGFKQHQILSIAMSAIKGLHGIHTIGYYHRDVKIENILIGKDGKYKLCDFGSCTNQQIDFKVIPKSDYNDYLQQIESFTTPMYRPPQMVDPYLKYKVSFKADIWMLGCTLYTLCYFVHPFLDSNAVGIANAVFRFPVYPSETKYQVSEKVQDLIRLMLTPDPQHRPTLKQLATIISQWQNIKEIPLNPVAKRLKEQHTQKQQQLQSLNKKTVDIDGDIPIEKLMALQNKIRNKECNKQTSSFITDSQTKKIRQNQQSHSQKNNFQQVSDSFGVSINQNNKKNNVFNNKDIWGSSPQQSHPNNASFTKAQSKPSFDAFSDFGNFGSTHSKPTPKKQQIIKTNNDFMEFFQQTPVQQNTISQGKKQKQKFDLLDI